MTHFLKKMDWQLNAAVLIITALGIISLAASSPDLFYKQLIWAIIGIFLLFLFSIINLKQLSSYNWMISAIFIFALLLLLLTQFIGITVSGSQSWIPIGPFSFQPSEFAKLALIIALAAFFSRRHIGIKRLEIIFGSFIYCALPVILILLEPDVGTALIFFSIWFGYLLASGLPIRYLAASLPFLLIISILIWQFGFQDYHRDRILALFSPEADPLGINYNVIQSKIAIGSAGLWGKGFGQGTQTMLGFLPAAHTDFAFATFVEEWGIISGALLLSIFMFIIFKISRIGIRAYGNFYKFLCVGTILFLLSQFTINIGSVLGLLPVVGIAFPFLSYGGSNLITSFILISIVQNIAVKNTV